MRNVCWVAFVVFAAACGHAKEGDPCQDGQPQCLDGDKHTALFCSTDTMAYVAVPCPGPGGCVATTDQSLVVVACDIQGVNSGDNCVPDFAGFVHCIDASHALICGGDIWRAETCDVSCMETVDDPAAGGLSGGACQSGM